MTSLAPSGRRHGKIGSCGVPKVVDNGRSFHRKVEREEHQKSNDSTRRPHRPVLEGASRLACENCAAQIKALQKVRRRGEISHFGPIIFISARGRAGFGVPFSVTQHTQHSPQGSSSSFPFVSSTWAQARVGAKKREIAEAGLSAVL